jgi:lipopolysaccharide transport system permease protein
MAESVVQPDAAPRHAANEAVVIRDHQPTVREMVSQTWGYRSLILRLGMRRIVKGYSGTRIGRPWLLIRPLFSIFGMALIFGSVLQAPSNGVPYLLFLLIGTIGWTVIERTVFWATRSVDIYHKVVGRLAVPVLLAPAAALAPVLVDVLVTGGIGVGVVAYYTISTGELAIQLGPSTLIAVAGLLLGLMLAFGIGVWLATLNALARDVRILLTMGLPIWMYITPVIYSVDSLPERWRWLGTVNPAAAPVEMVKEGLLGIGFVTAPQLAVSIGAMIVILSTGLWFMTRLSPTLLRATPFIDEEEEDRV